MITPGILRDALKRLYILQHDLNNLHVNDKSGLTAQEYIKLVKILSKAEMELLQMVCDYETESDNST